MIEQKENFNQISDTETINIREELEKYLIHWKWFVIGVVLALIVAFVFLRYSTPEYTASTTILIKDDKQTGISAELAAFEDLGIIGGGSANNTDNEIEILKSRKIIGNVVDSLGLTISYSKVGRIRDTELYSHSPINLKFIKINSSLKVKDTVFIVSFLGADSVELKDVEGNLILKTKLNEVVESEIGHFKLVRSKSYDSYVQEELNELIIFWVEILL